jgi:hypothetical protein
MAWEWHRIVPLLEKAQHEAIAIDLPADDPRAGLRDYADIVVRAIGTRTNVVLVAQSLGGFVRRTDLFSARRAEGRAAEGPRAPA